MLKGEYKEVRVITDVLLVSNLFTFLGSLICVVLIIIEINTSVDLNISEYKVLLGISLPALILILLSSLVLGYIELKAHMKIRTLRKKG